MHLSDILVIEGDDGLQLLHLGVVGQAAAILGLCRRSTWFFFLLGNWSPIIRPPPLGFLSSHLGMITSSILKMMGSGF